ncbi:MAG TPA: potassium transporter TrkG [Steroidobacteraceae bacterium]|jgi:trk system potassium uptake protein TrkH|nr:potassium transporter TrkG [Steroidobacteraceae bacterium]
MRSLIAVLNIFGSLLAWFALYFLLPILTGLMYGEFAPLRGFFVGGAVAVLLGLTLRAMTRRYRYDLKARDAYLLVCVSWLAIAAVATIPLLLDVPGLSFTRAYFETMSGLSTTGATVLTGLDHLPRSLVLWRAALSWLGGMGIIVLAVAILPLLGVGGMQLYRAGAPGTVKDAKLAPRITETARVLGLVYAGLTLACMLALWGAGMSPFDALCHAFATLSLGGFSTHDANIAYFNSPLIEFILALFMLVAALNFSTHFIALRRGDFSCYRRDPEARWTLLLVLVSCCIIIGFLMATHVYDDGFKAFRYGAFNVISLATGGGFFNADFSTWPIFAPMWMLFLSSLCANTGSTGGGIKMFRALILFKQPLREMFTLVHPQAVSPLKISRQVVPNGVVYAVLAFLFLYFLTIVGLTFALLISGLDLTSSLSAIVACINNLGPGLGRVGPSHAYAALNGFQIWVCTAAMFLGRIEIITFAVVLTPAFWRK